ncbi:hypothetical protein I603_2152 [Erythrobacter dokdonensis DSW-74]|uniref:Uncharacterized protein n=1 Tax=Erythrobacter dokdonensis DSW-74 TaxID=1300349 RepID=A0A1A7BH58_9SPHN|nr:hypothetical protein I603_2152 [Erythrobacter dokdonensis DSW-74]
MPNAFDRIDERHPESCPMIPAMLLPFASTCAFAQTTKSPI